MTEFSVVIPGNPPSVNETYKVVHHPPFCLSCGRGIPRLGKHANVEAWQDSVAWLTRAAKPTGWQPSRRVRISVSWWTERAGRDADGPVKALLDGIKIGLGCDDKLFLHTIVSNEKDKANPRTEVTIWNES